MKRFFAFFLSIIMLVAGLGGCTSSESPAPVETSPGSSKAEQPPHSHTYESYHDEIGHGWAYTCGCMTPPNFAQHIDSNGDRKCDDCEYVFPKNEPTSQPTTPAETKPTIPPETRPELLTFENIHFADASFPYNGEKHSIFVTNAPGFASITYKGNGQREVGCYTVTATVTAEGYKPLTLTAKLTITQRPIVDTDTNQQGFSFDQSLRYDDLLAQLMKHNFTLTVESGTEQKYPDGKVQYTTHSYDTFAICQGKFYHKTDYITEDEYTYDTIELAQIINGKVVVVSYAADGSNASYSTLPVEAFYETFVGFYVAAPFAYLKESPVGGFENASLEAYATEYGEYAINPEKPNTFVLKVRNYYFHPEFTNSEVFTYTYSNIGNTAVNFDKTYLSNAPQELTPRGFSLNGVEYHHYDGEWAANIYISFFDLIYVPKGAHTIFAELYAMPVSAIYLPYRVYNQDYTGYAYNVYFDAALNYQGQYSGEIETKYGTARYDAIDYFVDHGGKYNYFGQW